MSDDRSLAAPGQRGLRLGVVSVLIAVAFLLGLALAMVLVRRQQAREDATVLPAVAQTDAPLQATAPPPPTPDAALLAARQEVLAGQLAALESRAAALSASAQAAGTQATRAETVLSVVAARRAIDRGVALGALDSQLQSRFGLSQPRAVALVRAAAREPVTLEELRQGLDAVGTTAAAGVREGWLESLRREFGSLIVVRRAGTISQLPADRLARARRLLAAGQVEAARAEVAQLPGAEDAAGWLAAARRYALARRALDVLENAALAEPLATPFS